MDELAAALPADDRLKLQMVARHSPWLAGTRLDRDAPQARVSDRTVRRYRGELRARYQNLAWL